MGQITLHIKFSTLRSEYIEVKNFLQKETGENKITLATKLVDDLFLYGDDNYDLLTKFVSKYNLSIDGFDYSSHFESESEIANNGMLFVGLLFLPFFFIVWLIRVVAAGGKKWRSIEFYPDWKGPQKMDITFAEMVIWKLNKSYNLRATTKIVLE